ncbi:hypothetical protein GCM10027445_44980 [Amycolatopsis endophytica]|uniref:EmrB/QacA subfamily drug resistance transporter n=1 Tax=Amycolatopsis endophytica TaxID=860233 RepID=A0A853B0T2_9PSEU|nr:MFS transporter [Amycolatopsis endophytica]NYI88610.1 EmrB/QacA subfamily drug resistance transporter [Amycolatopsis endophytica]
MTETKIVANRVLLAAVYLASFMALLDASVVTVALPTVQRDFGGPLANLQWVFDGYTLALATAMLSGGVLGDRFGRRRVFLAGLALFTVASLACALAPGIGWLVAARIVQGAAASVLIPGGLSLLAQAFSEPARRARALGLGAVIGGLAFVAGPLLGGPLTETFGWQSIFLINLPLGAVALVLGVRGITESADPSRPGLDPVGQVLAIAWTGLLVYAVIEAGHAGWSAPRVVGCLAAAAVCLAAFLVAESRGRSPMLPLTFFRDGDFAVVNLASFVLGAASYGGFFLLSLYLQGPRGASATEAGLWFLPLVLATSAMGAVSGRVSRRIGLLAGYPLCAAGLRARSCWTPPPRSRSSRCCSW